MQATRVTLELSSDEALVLYDWPTHFNQRDDIEFADQAETRVLFDLEAMLEKEIVAPLQPDYAALLAQARAHVRNECA
jgi:hypothetical protein